MKTLELKHLAGYLPYGLPIKLRQEEQISRGEWKEFEYDNFLNGVLLEMDLKNITPILHPLSDLVKEIEINDNKFVPKDILDETHISHWSYNNITKLTINDLQDAPFWFTNKLIEWHFDIHGLIEQNLALDINKI